MKRLIAALVVMSNCFGKQVSPLTARALERGYERDERLRRDVEFIERRWVNVHQIVNPEGMVPPRFFTEDDYLHPNFREDVVELVQAFQDNQSIIDNFIRNRIQRI